MSDRNQNANNGNVSETPVEGDRLIRLPEHVEAKIERRLPKTNFESVDEYATFVLESLLRELDEGDDAVDDAPEHHDDAPENSEAIQDRLESLGYL